ncbi:MAG: hypothetical protein NT113_07485 [Hyphomicrobiales bacterium]|nr:hypothetical protein [Hyphomicrobiales bacterium]
MGDGLRRSLAMVLAVALVVAGMPMAHAMPADVSAIAAAQHHGDPVVEATSHGHHCDEQATEAASADDAGQADAAAPCKCLNCSLCVAGFFNPISCPVTFDRALIATFVYGWHRTADRSRHPHPRQLSNGA